MPAKNTTDFKIEHGIPLARAKQHENSVRRKYPFPEMKVGDSFFMPATNKLTRAAVLRKASAAASNHGRTYGVRFNCRTVEGGVRLWRIA